MNLNIAIQGAINAETRALLASVRSREVIRPTDAQLQVAAVAGANSWALKATHDAQQAGGKA